MSKHTPGTTKGSTCLGCGHKWAQRDRQRILRHATTCQKLSPALRTEASGASAAKAPSAQHPTPGSVEENGSYRDPAPSLAPSDSISQAQGSGSGVSSALMTNFLADGSKTKRQSIDKALNKALMAFMTCQGLPASFLSNVYTKHFFSIANPQWRMPSTSTYETALLPSEASFVRKQVTAILQASNNLTLSFDGWGSRLLESIYTLTMTEEARRSHFWDFHSDTAASHTGPFIAEFLITVSFKAYLSAIIYSSRLICIP